MRKERVVKTGGLEFSMERGHHYFSKSSTQEVNLDQLSAHDREALLHGETIPWYEEFWKLESAPRNR